MVGLDFLAAVLGLVEERTCRERERERERERSCSSSSSGLTGRDSAVESADALSTD